MKKLCLCAAVFVCVALSAPVESEEKSEQICLPRAFYENEVMTYRLLLKIEKHTIDSLRLVIKQLQSAPIESMSGSRQ
jgi:hypothetical protein